MLSKINTMGRLCREVKIPVPWGKVAAKWWEPYTNKPILVVHGWQDNCGSFNRLIPLLSEKVGFLAIDLPGHGRSSNLPPGMNYYSLHTPVLLRHIANFFKWEKLAIMGHSMGASDCYIFCQLFPQLIDYFISIDGLNPREIKHSNYISNEIDRLLKYDKQLTNMESRPSHSMDALKKSSCDFFGNSMRLEHCHHVLERSTIPSNTPNKYYVTRDPRLKILLDLEWSPKHLEADAVNLQMPILYIRSNDTEYHQEGEDASAERANKGYLENMKYFEFKEQFYHTLPILEKVSKDFVMVRVEGTHHVHLNNPERIAEHVNNFIIKHHVEDKSYVMPALESNL